MAPGSWIPGGTPVAGNGSEKPFTHPNGATATRRFYRIALDE